MPKITKPIPETDNLVVRKVALGVIQEVLIDRMGLSKDITINFPGYAEVAAQPHGLISSKFEDNRFPTTNKLSIEVTEEPVVDWMPANVVDKPEHIPLFLCKDLEVEIRPVYTSMEMRISLHYRAQGKTDARRFYNLMLTKIPRREDVWLHELKYSFGMPEAFEVILKAIHELVEKQDGYGEDYDTFFAKWVNPRHGLLTDQAGKNTIGVFSDTQCRVQGFFDIGPAPDFGGKKDETEVWEIEIPYVVRYEKPTDCWFNYPIVIHNSVLGRAFRDTTGMKRIQDYQQTRTWSMAHLQSFEAESRLGRPYNEHPGRYFPLYDEFMPRNVPQNSMRIFTSLVMVETDPDSTEPRLLMNIDDLERPQFGMQINDCIKEFLRTEHEWVTKPQQSALQLSLYMGRLLMNHDWLEMDEDLNIRSVNDLNKRKYYHVRLGICTDLTYLTAAAKQRLMAKPCALSNLLEYILPEGSRIPPFEVKNGVVSRQDFDWIADWLRGQKGMTTMKTVQHTRLNGVYRMKT